MGSHTRSGPVEGQGIRVSESDGFVVVTDLETGVTSQGETKPVALTNLAEALELYEEPVLNEKEAGMEPSTAPWLDT